jgi:hypothetical protein
MFDKTAPMFDKTASMVYKTTPMIYKTAPMFALFLKLGVSLPKCQSTVVRHTV